MRIIIVTNTTTPNTKTPNSAKKIFQLISFLRLRPGGFKVSLRARWAAKIVCRLFLLLFIVFIFKSIQRCISIFILTKPRSLNNSKCNRLAIDLCVDRFHAGRAIERSKRPKHHRQCFAGTRQALASFSLNLDKGWNMNRCRFIQVQIESARPAF